MLQRALRGLFLGLLGSFSRILKPLEEKIDQYAELWALGVFSIIFSKYNAILNILLKVNLTGS